MSENEEQSGNFPWLPLITLIAVGSGVFLLSPQITSSRPGGGDPKLVDTFDDQAINARLWQDPLGVVMGQQETDKPKTTRNIAHSIERFRELLIQKCFSPLALSPLTRERQFAERMQRFQSFEICAVMIPGGPYVEDVERRIRARRAVLEGLSQAGYGPERDHELGYICLPWRPLAQNAAESISMLEYDRRGKANAGPFSSEWSNDSGQSDTLFLPYEWYELEDFRIQDKPKHHVLLLWLNDDAVVDAPLARLADLLSRFHLESLANGDGIAPLYDYVLPLPRVIVLGPDNSQTLLSMALEAKTARWNAETRDLLATTHIYSCQASVANENLIAEAEGDSSRFEDFVERALKTGAINSGFSFERTLPLDDKIVETLWGEIDKHRFNPADGVAVISELDTFCARALTHSFISAPRNRSRINIVDAYNYIRGIDGKIPNDGKEKESREAAGNVSDKTQLTSRPGEETEGLNQADDIRRLAKELQRRDGELRAKNGGRLKAVGLLGSDVYDKLELLKALRPALPEAIFFTNNLDARLFHPDEWSETRNLIVAAPFDLSLKGYEKIPPFRDSEQTSLFAATLKAFGKDAEVPSMPFIFEVGRSGVEELKTPIGDAEKRAMTYLRICSIIGIGAMLAGWIFVTSRVEGLNS
jgi:hypothetical protein